MKQLHIILLLICVPFFGAKQLCAQISVSSNASVVPVVNKAFEMKGVEISNITFTGSAAQIGYFKGARNAIGIDSGLVMSSGIAKGIQTGNLSEKMGTGTTDEDLQKIGKYILGLYGATGEQDRFVEPLDAVTIEFDLVSVNKEVSLKYAFASKEHEAGPLEATADLMGIFIAGPGISGAYSSPAEFPNGSALISNVPGTNPAEPVSVTSVNRFENSSFFLNNPQPNPPNGPRQNPENPFPGYTSVFTINLQVETCTKYHIKLAVSDGYEPGNNNGDTFDGALFLNATAFEKPKYDFTLFEKESTIPSTRMVEDCKPLDLEIRRFQEITLQDTVFLSFANVSEVKNADMVSPVSRVIFAPGESSIRLTLSALDDGLVEAIENGFIQFDYRYGCLGYEEKIAFTLEDVPPIVAQRVSPFNTPVNCLGEEITLEVSATGGFENQLLYSWKKDGVITGDAGPVYNDIPTATITEYAVSVSDGCNNETSIQFTASVKVNDSIDIVLADTLGSACAGSSFSVSPTAIEGGSGVYTYLWEYGAGDSATGPSLIFIPNEAGFVYFTVADDCNMVAKDSTYIGVGQQRDIRLEVSADTMVCAGQPVNLTATASGGTGNLSYSWPAQNKNTSSITYVPNRSQRVEVVVTDDCQVTNSDDIVVDVNNVLADYEYFYENSDALFLDSYSVGEGLILEWIINDSLVSQAAQLELPVPSYNDNLNVKLRVTDFLGCQDSLEHVISPPLNVYMPNAFTPDNDGYNDTYKVVAEDLESFRMTIYDRWGRVVFESDDITKGWDGYLPESRERALGMYAVHVVAVRNSKSRYDGYGSIAVLY